jgi:hypothetical protein
VDNHQQTAFERKSHGKIALFRFRVSRIGDCNDKWIVEDGGAFIESDSMFREISFGFLQIPFEDIVFHGSFDYSVIRPDVNPGG